MSSGQPPKKPPEKKPVATGDAKGRDTGAALRSIYQKAVDETVPSDLLGKLN